MAESIETFSFDDVELTLTYSAHTDRGLVRSVNEDSFLASAPIFAVADGMGGHAHGDLASRAAIAAIASAFPTSDAARPEQVVDAIQQANHDVLAISAQAASMSIDEVAAGPTVSGTTLTGVAFVRVQPGGDGRWMVFNVGDSRVYGWDGRHVTQLTVDHSVVQDLVDSGSITPADALVHPARNVVTRALGSGAEVHPDLWLMPVVANHAFLICSDGLTRELGDDEIARIVELHGSQDPPRASSLAEELVAAAVSAGGRDNVTVVVVRCDSVRDQDAADDPSGTARVTVAS